MKVNTNKYPVIDLVIDVKSAKTGETKSYKLTGTALIQPKEKKHGCHSIK